MGRGGAASGCILGSITFALLLFSVCFPWYFYTVEFKGTNCKLTYLEGWYEMYCHGAEDNIKLCQCIDDQFNWRDKGDFSNLQKLLDACLALMIVAIVCCFAMTTVFLVMCLAKPNLNPTMISATMAFFGLVGLATLAAAIIVYAVKLPSARSDDSYLFCTAYKLISDGPCDSFWGDFDNSVGHFTFGPAGWAPAVVGWICLLVLSIVGCLAPR